MIKSKRMRDVGHIMELNMKSTKSTGMIIYMHVHDTRLHKLFIYCHLYSSKTILFNIECFHIYIYIIENFDCAAQHLRGTGQL